MSFLYIKFLSFDFLINLSKKKLFHNTFIYFKFIKDMYRDVEVEVLTFKGHKWNARIRNKVKEIFSFFNKLKLIKE